MFFLCGGALFGGPEFVDEGGDAGWFAVELESGGDAAGRGAEFAEGFKLGDQRGAFA